MKKTHITAHNQKSDWPHIRKPPAPIAKVIDAVMADDRRWFQDHPAEEVRIRSAVPGEFWPMDQSSVIYVIVGQVTPGFRLRAAVARLNQSGGVQ
jgi:hypothetical protein